MMIAVWFPIHWYLSYEEAKKLMPSEVFVYRYQQHHRWVMDAGGIQQNRSWGVNRYFQ